MDKYTIMDVIHDEYKNQAYLMTVHTKDDKTELLYHAWDETKESEWADKVTGLKVPVHVYFYIQFLSV